MIKFIILFFFFIVCKCSIVRIGAAPPNELLFSLGEKYAIASSTYSWDQNYTIYFGDNNGVVQVPQAFPEILPVLGWNNHLLYLKKNTSAINKLVLYKLNADTFESTAVFSYDYSFSNGFPSTVCLFGNKIIYTTQEIFPAVVRAYDLSVESSPDYNGTIIAVLPRTTYYADMLECKIKNDGMLVYFDSTWLLKASGEVALVRAPNEEHYWDFAQITTDGNITFASFYPVSTYVYQVTATDLVPLNVGYYNNMAAYKGCLFYKYGITYQMLNTATNVTTPVLNVPYTYAEHANFDIYFNFLFFTLYVRNSTGTTNSYKFLYKSDGTPEGSYEVGLLGGFNLKDLTEDNYVASGCGNLFILVGDNYRSSVWVTDGYQMKLIVEDITTVGKFTFHNTSLVFTALISPDLKKQIYTYDLGTCGPYSGGIRTTTTGQSSTSSSPSSSPSTSTTSLSPTSSTSSNDQDNTAPLVLFNFASLVFVFVGVVFASIM